MNYREIVRDLEARTMMPDRPPSLYPTREGLEKLGLRIDPERVVVVAGTNGKGSVCAQLDSLLASAGERVGLYTSPHLVETTERFRLAGADISQELFCEAYRRVDAATRGTRLTHFEMLTLMAAWLFFSGEGTAPVDRAIFEVGLGGTWDATNALPHRFCVITRLGIDHANLLGNSLEEIAQNKLGILTKDASVVHSPFAPEIEELARKTAAGWNARLIAAEPFPLETIPGGPGEAPEFWLRTAWGRARLALPGARAAENATTALQTFAALGYDPAPHLSALEQVRWPGRMERVQVAGAPCPLYLSGDHNPQGIASLLELLPSFTRTHLHVLLATTIDKDLDGVCEPLLALPDTSLYFTETPYRTRPLASYGRWLDHAKGARADPGEALRNVLRRARPGELVLVTGSLYLVGAIKRDLATGRI